ncbi:MAG: hypothetical protein JXQ97_13900 [Natronospirillum sp.]
MAVELRLYVSGILTDSVRQTQFSKEKRVFAKELNLGLVVAPLSFCDSDRAAQRCRVSVSEPVDSRDLGRLQVIITLEKENFSI